MIPRYLPCSEYAEEFGVEEFDRCGNTTGGMPGVRADVGIVETRKRAWRSPCRFAASRTS